MAAGVASIAPGSPCGVAVGFTAASMRAATYDLLVGADGVGSAVRTLWIGPPDGVSVKIEFPGWGHWHALLEPPPPGKSGQPANPPAWAAAAESAGVDEMWGGGGGRRLTSFPLAGGRAAFLAAVDHPRPLRPEPQPAARARAAAAAFSDFGGPAPPPAAALLAAAAAAAKPAVGFKYPAVVRILGQAREPGLPVALVGDAAHAVLPSFHQGPALVSLNRSQPLTRALKRTRARARTRTHVASIYIRARARARTQVGLHTHARTCAHSPFRTEHDRGGTSIQGGTCLSVRAHARRAYAHVRVCARAC
jgi:hypothetical protein